MGNCIAKSKRRSRSSVRRRSSLKNSSASSAAAQPHLSVLYDHFHNNGRDFQITMLQLAEFLKVDVDNIFLALLGNLLQEGRSKDSLVSQSSAKVKLHNFILVAHLFTSERPRHGYFEQPNSGQDECSLFIWQLLGGSRVATSATLSQRAFPPNFPQDLKERLLDDDGITFVECESILSLFPTHLQEARDLWSALQAYVQPCKLLVEHGQRLVRLSRHSNRPFATIETDSDDEGERPQKYSLGVENPQKLEMLTILMNELPARWSSYAAAEDLSPDHPVGHRARKVSDTYVNSPLRSSHNYQRAQSVSSIKDLRKQQAGSWREENMMQLSYARDMLQCNSSFSSDMDFHNAMLASDARAMSPTGQAPLSQTAQAQPNPQTAAVEAPRRHTDQLRANPRMYSAAQVKERRLSDSAASVMIYKLLSTAATSARTFSQKTGLRVRHHRRRHLSSDGAQRVAILNRVSRFSGQSTTQNHFPVSGGAPLMDASAFMSSDARSTTDSIDILMCSGTTQDSNATDRSLGDFGFGRTRSSCEKGRRSRFSGGGFAQVEQGASSDAGAGSGAGSGAGEERRSTLRLSKHELAVYMDMDVVCGLIPHRRATRSFTNKSRSRRPSLPLSRSMYNLQELQKMLKEESAQFEDDGTSRHSTLTSLPSMDPKPTKGWFNSRLSQSQTDADRAPRRSRKAGLAADDDEPQALSEHADHPKDPDLVAFLSLMMRHTALFRHTGKVLQSKLIRAMSRVAFKRDEVIVRQGELDSSSFFIVESGISRMVEETWEPLTNRMDNMLFSRGSVFGDFTLLLGLPPEYTVVAETDLVMWTIDRKTFVSVKAQHNKELNELVQGVPSLQCLLPKERQSVVDVLQHVTFKKGEKVVRQGQVGDRFYIVQKGTLHMYNDRKKTVVQTLQAGCSFGGRALRHSEMYVMSVQCQTDCELWYIERKTFVELVGHFEEVMRWSLLRMIDVLTPLTDRQISELVGEVQVHTLGALEVLHPTMDHVYIVEQRELVLVETCKYKAGEMPTEHTGMISTLEQGATLGEEAVTLGVPHTYTVHAGAMGAVLVSVSKEQLTALGVLEAKRNNRPKKASFLVEEYEGDETNRIVDIENAEILALLGDGGYASVYLVMYKGNMYAMKKICKAHIASKNLGKFVQRERYIGLNFSDSKFVTKMFYSAQDEKSVYLLSEPCQGGDFFAHMERNCSLAGFGLSEATAAFYAACVVLALEYLHEQGVVYRDLKPENMLLDERGYLKLTDLGFAKLLSGKSYTTCGTLDYMSPEMVQKQGHGFAVDWWSLGVLIFEMVTGLPPFYKARNDRIKVEMIRHAKYFAPQYLSREVKSIVKGFLTVNPSERLGSTLMGVSTVKSHPWFANIDWVKLAKQEHNVPKTILSSATLPMYAGDKHIMEKQFDQILTKSQSDKIFKNF